MAGGTRSVASGRIRAAVVVVTLLTTSLAVGGTAAQAASLRTHLVTWEGAGHVPYVENREQILELTQNFLFHSLGVRLLLRAPVTLLSAPTTSRGAGTWSR